MTAKPPYKGDGTWANIPNFSEELRSSLRPFYQEQQGDVDPFLECWGNPTDRFVDAVLAEACWAKAELHMQGFGCTKTEIRAEQSDLLKLLQKANDRLRSLSPDFDRLLGVGADPLGCADRITELIDQVENANSRIDEMPVAPKEVDKERFVAVELSVRVLRVLERYGIKAAATAGTYLKLADITNPCSYGDESSRYVSPAVRILKAIGDDIGLVRAEATWRSIIGDARQKPSAIQSREAPEK